MRRALVECIALAALLPGCSGLLPGSDPSTPKPSLAPADPTPLARCKVAASAGSPLVTEWPASEKAHLQSLAAIQTVAVQYSGCELQIVDACKLSGKYVWQPTTLASDTVEITNADELYAKLPIGAVSLEGELERSGRLAVRTTVAGQLRLDGMTEASIPRRGACASVTHVVTGISVGAFKLLSGGAIAGGAGVGLAGAKSQRSESVVREAGVPTACSESTPEAPHPQCTSPIQVFLSSVRREETPLEETRARNEDEARATGVMVSLPGPDDRADRWTLRDYRGDEICVLPCDRWVRPNSGYYLQRERSDSGEIATVKLPDRFVEPVGSSVGARYQAERGSPFWSTLTFYGFGIPVTIGGAIFLVLGITGDDCDISDPNCDRDPFAGAFGIISGSLWLAMGGVSAYWYFWSHPARFETVPAGSQNARRSGAPSLAVGQPGRRPAAANVTITPTGVRGTF